MLGTAKRKKGPQSCRHSQDQPRSRSQLTEPPSALRPSQPAHRQGPQLLTPHSKPRHLAPGRVGTGGGDGLIPRAAPLGGSPGTTGWQTAWSFLGSVSLDEILVLISAPSPQRAAGRVARHQGSRRFHKADRVVQPWGRRPQAREGPTVHTASFQGLKAQHLGLGAGSSPLL